MRPFSRFGLGVVTATTMATSTFVVVVVGIIAVQLIDEFDISRAQVGLVVTASALTGAVASPVFGRITDLIGAVKSVVWTLVIGFVALVALALSPVYLVLLAAAVLNGISNGWGNPATNALIVDNVAPGERGIVTGVKQSGVQVGTFLSGLLVPVFERWWSWRVALLIFLAMPAGGLVGMVGRRQPNTNEDRAKSREGGRIPVSVRWVAAYGLISGLATSAIIAFLPLFANEDLGWSEAAGGGLIAIIGLAGIGARIFWPRLAETTLGHGPTLRILAWMGVGTCAFLWMASVDILGGWVLVPSAVLLGGGAVAWNAVGMLAVMDFSPHGLVGKGTGVVLFGFLIGLALGPPAMGYSVDALGSYGPGWIVAAALLIASSFFSAMIPSTVTATSRAR